MQPPNSDVLRILIATDNHLGFLSSDPIRGEDSFDTLDEILQIGRDKHCDCAFFSGDLFHHNKPSRRVMYRAQQVFKKHVFGPGAVSIQVTSDHKQNFGGRMANYEDPSLSVQFPIFMIHGNHDDPSREGPIGESLSAIDILAEAGLVNYFGRADKANDIKIRPVMIEKGETTRVALYGLGWVRDERLHRTFNEKKVTFVREAGDGLANNAFNVMLIHQNRAQKGRGEKNGVAESMIPDFMDLVFWGHEHECEIKPVEKGSYFLSQPGSSIAVSLIEAEAVPKHCGILEVRCDPNTGEPTYRLIPIKLKSVRPFLLDTSLELALVPELNSLNLPEQEKQERVFEYLTNRVEKMLEDYYDNQPAKDFADIQQQEEEKRIPIPICRIKVEHTGFTTINLQRFGAQFMSRVANPDEILQFYRKKKLVATTARRNKSSSDLGDDVDDSVIQDGEDDEEEYGFQSATDRIQRLSEQVLRESAQKLELLGEFNMHLAVEDFVVKENATSIAEFVEESIERMRNMLSKERKEHGNKLGNDASAVEEAISAFMENERKKNEALREKTGLKQARELEDVKLITSSSITPPSVAAAAAAADLGTEDEEEEEEVKPKKRAPATAPAKKTTRPAAAKKPVEKKKPAAATKKRAMLPLDDDDEDDEVEEVIVPVKRTRAAATTKKSRLDEDFEDDSDGGATSSMLSQAKFGVKRRG